MAPLPPEEIIFRNERIPIGEEAIRKINEKNTGWWRQYMKEKKELHHEQNQFKNNPKNHE